MTGFIRKLFLISFYFIFFQNSKAQNNDFEAGLFNVGIGSIVGGLGAVINKQPQEKFGKTLLKGMGQGALGGYLVFESKRLVREFATSGNYGYVWPSKLVNSAGTSIIENAAANRDFWERWHLNFGFNRVELSTKENFKISYKIMPFALYSSIYNSTIGKFDFVKSIKLGTPVFKADNILTRGINARGVTSTNSIILKNNINNPYEVEGHELIHVYQYENFSGFNSFFLKTQEKLKGKYIIVNNYSKIFYTDLNAALLSGFYGLETLRVEKDRDNFIEKEAYYFSK